MLSLEIAQRFEAMERRCDGMAALAQLLLGQANRQRKELADMKARINEDSLNPRVNGSGTIHAPSLAAMLKMRPG
jgi:hypothetical protein